MNAKRSATTIRLQLSDQLKDFVRGGWRRSSAISGLIALTALFEVAGDASFAILHADPVGWRSEWRQTDFSRHSVPFAEIKSGGPAKDGIPSIDTPRFEQLDHGKPIGWSAGLVGVEPVIAVSIDSDARAYPLRVLIWHEIANDTVGTRRVRCSCPAIPRRAITAAIRMSDMTQAGKGPFSMMGRCLTE